MMKAFFSAVTFFLLTTAVSAQTPNTPVVKVDVPEIVAEVNGDKITKNMLAAECLQLYGESELQESINKTLVKLECERQKITVTADEIDSEIVRMAKAFKISSDQLLEVMSQKRRTSPEQIRQEIHTRLALAKLACSRVQITDGELKRAYDSQFGPAVQARQIVLSSRAEAETLLAELKQHPETFPAVAKNRSIDTVTQPFGGMLPQPIRRNTVNPNIEKILFALQPGEISPVVEWIGGQFIIFRCERHLQPVEVDYETVREQLIVDQKNSKLRQVADDVFTELKKNTKVQIVFGNMALAGQYPGVAALLNGQIISQKELAENCIAKYGKDVLGDVINRLLVEQACRREKITITEQDIDNEIREMAFKFLPLKEDGSADVELWLRRSTEETGLSVPMYRKNTIIPVLALKKLTRKDVIVTEEDVQRSYEANFGRKVNCLAIIFGAEDQRRAQEVWGMANRHKTAENFSELAEKFSVDPDTRQGRGVIPPIAKYCGQPELEKEAFSLLPNELSQIIQVDETLVILYCVGYIEPKTIRIEEVKADIVADIFEKKQQLIISRTFEKLYGQAAFDNYLTGESQNPAVEKAMRETPKR